MEVAAIQPGSKGSTNSQQTIKSLIMITLLIWRKGCRKRKKKLGAVSANRNSKSIAEMRLVRCILGTEPEEGIQSATEKGSFTDKMF